MGVHKNVTQVSPFTHIFTYIHFHVVVYMCACVHVHAGMYVRMTVCMYYVHMLPMRMSQKYIHTCNAYISCVPCGVAPEVAYMPVYMHKCVDAYAHKHKLAYM